jgi:hypothetical protein
VTHQCDGQHELRAARLLLAMLTADSAAVTSFAAVDAELNGCAKCWRAVAQWLAQLVAGRDALQAGSVEAAADAVADGIELMVMRDEN